MAGSNVIEIINAISRVVTEKGHHGALDEKGEPVKIGLKREEEISIQDPQVMDGFGVQFQNDRLRISYQCEVLLKDVHDKGFEQDKRSMISKVATFLRKEYKELTGKALTLTAEADTFDAIVQSTSRVRSWVEAHQYFKIGGVSEAEYSSEDPQKDKLDAAVKNWLEQSKKPKKPENVDIKPSDNEAPDPYKKKKVK